MKTQFAVLTSLAIIATTQAQDLHDADFVLSIENDRLVAGVFDPQSGNVVTPFRVKSSVLGAEGFPNFTNDPGFNAQLGQLIPGMSIGFSILSAPRIWDNDSMDFETIAPDSIVVRAAGQSIDAPSADTVVEGIVFGQASSSPSASFHHHMQYLLNGGLPPTIDGLWLLELELWTTLSNIEPSEPLYLIFAQGDSEAQLNDAIAWVEDNLVGTSCLADFNGDGLLNFFDVSLFLSGFTAGDAASDLNNDGVLNFFDVSLYLSAFGQGCP
jgi:hypothetical protein